MNRLDLSIIFITKNEEFHIGNAIDNVKDIAEEIFVVDSGSTDKTVEIAESKGAKVLFHAFEGFGKQWNWALENCPIKTAWTMKMDPDERLTDALKSEIEDSLANRVELAGFEFDRVLWFMGKRIPGWKDRVVRIWRTGHCRFTDIVVNEHPIVDGKIGILQSTMDHLDSRDLGQWIEKQNKYTTAEAIRQFAGGPLAARPRFWGTRLERRMWFKSVFFKLPFRYEMMFFQLYFGKGLFLVGKTGFHCALLRIWVRRLVEQKLLEMRNTGRLTSS